MELCIQKKAEPAALNEAIALRIREDAERIASQRLADGGESALQAEFGAEDGVNGIDMFARGLLMGIGATFTRQVLSPARRWALRSKSVSEQNKIGLPEAIAFAADAERSYFDSIKDAIEPPLVDDIVDGVFDAARDMLSVTFVCSTELARRTLPLEYWGNLGEGIVCGLIDGTLDDYDVPGNRQMSIASSREARAGSLIAFSQLGVAVRRSTLEDWAHGRENESEDIVSDEAQ